MPRPKYDDIPSQYEPKEIEARWAEYWINESLYRADPKVPGEAFSIVIPPPNVTGVLHMGHALNATLQDILVRHARMQGKNVAWIVGTDHAGIATQNVVEKQLAAEGKKRHDLEREAFVERVWQWRHDSGGKIIEQLKRLGASCDFTRERFTMDEGLSRAVREVFVKLYEQQLIYRGERLINWCPRCETALSDLEVEYDEVKGHLWPMQYPIVGTDQRLIVATTRPETYLGDTAVAVHPDDERYQDVIGKEIELPFIARRIPIVADDSVDRAFGSGAVKITPAHDFTDFELGNRHGLPRISILSAKGILNENAGSYAGLERFAARKKIVQDLIDAGFIDEAAIQKHVHQVGHCYRCKTVLEPYLSMQWFVKMESLAKPALAAVRAGRTQFVPKNWENTYFQWLENIRDWCISRQIWWGHQIPAWYCPKGHVTVSREDPAGCAECDSKSLSRDPDVLDTWFSSALWPFSTLGWPFADREGLLARYYPTSVLVTGFDIIFFWVARMLMMGLYFMNEVPFKQVYIHALVRDASGQKMSKSKGNVMDPLYLMDKYGTDALRFTLAALAAQGRDIKLDEARIEGYRNFMNKIWNATRFIFRYLPEGEFNWQALVQEPSNFAPNHWVRERLAECIRDVEQAYGQYAFNEAAHAVYHFFWDDYCAWYIEWIKPILNSDPSDERSRTIATAVAVLETSLRLMHPLIPFITEEIWQWLGLGQSISLQGLPDPSQYAYDSAKAEEAQSVLGVIETIRRLRGENHISPGLKIPVNIIGSHFSAIQPYESMIVQMTRLEKLHYQDISFVAKKSALALCGDFKVAIPMQGLIDIDAELARLEKECDKIAKDIQKVETKFANPNFIARAPQELVAEDEALLIALKAKLAETQTFAKQLEDYR